MEFIAYCGNDCGQCPVFQATIANDDALRADCAKRFSNAKILLRPEEMNCYGCRSDYRCTKITSHCEILRCAEMKYVTNCSECENYPCPKIEKYCPAGCPNRDRLDGLVPWRRDPGL